MVQSPRARIQAERIQLENYLKTAAKKTPLHPSMEF